MDAAELELRNVTYRLFVELGRAPGADAVGSALDLDVESVRLGWQRLHEQHAIVLDGDGEIRMANPFSAVSTPHRVVAAGRSWYANCAWDAFGILAALGVDGRIETTCPDCEAPLVVEVRDGRPDDGTLVFHSLVDAAHWWDDIVFT
jgi:alkylmercury lyase-like protein